MMKNSLKSSFVKGHDFSHADKVNRISRALAPGLFRLLQLNFVSNLVRGVSRAINPSKFAGLQPLRVTP
jgi:hypothetical protein